MSNGLMLYVIPRSRETSKTMFPSFILNLDESYLIEYFIEGEGKKFLKELPNGYKVYIPTYNEEPGSEIDTSSYDVRLTYCNSEDFNKIPKSIMKMESSANKAVIKFIRNLSHHDVVINYY